MNINALPHELKQAVEREIASAINNIQPRTTTIEEIEFDIVLNGIVLGTFHVELRLTPQTMHYRARMGFDEPTSEITGCYYDVLSMDFTYPTDEQEPTYITWGDADLRKMNGHVAY